VLSRRLRISPGIVAPAALLVLMDNVIPNTLVAWSETRIDSGMASVLMSSMPLFTTVFAMTILRESASAVRIAGLVIGFIGVMIVSDGDVLRFQSNNGIGMLAVVAASSSHAAAAIYTKKLLARFDVTHRES
jgi:drug/metabolite transporter (DMT)-like permease